MQLPLTVLPKHPMRSVLLLLGGSVLKSLPKALGLELVFGADAIARGAVVDASGVGKTRCCGEA